MPNKPNANVERAGLELRLAGDGRGVRPYTEYFEQAAIRRHETAFLNQHHIPTRDSTDQHLLDKLP